MSTSPPRRRRRFRCKCNNPNVFGFLVRSLTSPNWPAGPPLVTPQFRVIGAGLQHVFMAPPPRATTGPPQRLTGSPLGSGGAPSPPFARPATTRRRCRRLFGFDLQGSRRLSALLRRCSCKQTDGGRVGMGHHRATTGPPPGYHWATAGLPPGHRWATTGLPLGYHWATRGLPVGRHWATQRVT